MNEPRYRYSIYHSRDAQSFTENEWLLSVYDHFIRLDGESDLEFSLFLISVFAEHRRQLSIVPFDYFSNKLAPNWVDGNIQSRCKHAMIFLHHIRRGMYRCLTCHHENRLTGRIYFCYFCSDAHTMTWEESINHDRTFHAKENSQ